MAKPKKMDLEGKHLVVKCSVRQCFVLELGLCQLMENTLKVLANFRLYTILLSYMRAS